MEDNPIKFLDEYRRAQVAAMDRIEQKLDDVKERIVRLEAHDTNVKISELEQKIEREKKELTDRCDRIIRSQEEKISENSRRLTIIETTDKTRMGVIGFIAGGISSIITATVMFFIKGS